eukprot:6467761-Amphidinium_carterae.1
MQCWCCSPNVVWGEVVQPCTFPGTSIRSLPTAKWSDDVLVKPGAAKQHWMFVVDYASVNTAQEFRARLPTQVRLCYINPGTTSIAQPCDVGTMKLFKALPGWADEAVKAVSSKRKIHHNAWGSYQTQVSRRYLRVQRHTTIQAPCSGGRSLHKPLTDWMLKTMWTLVHWRNVWTTKLITVAMTREDEDISVTEAPPKPKMTQAERLLALRICHGRVSKSDLETARSSKD